MQTITKIELPAADAADVLARCPWLTLALVARRWIQDGDELRCDVRVGATDGTRVYGLTADSIHDAVNVLRDPHARLLAETTMRRVAAIERQEQTGSAWRRALARIRRFSRH